MTDDTNGIQSPDGDDEPKSFEELEELANEGELTEDTLQSELARYRIAYQQEFETASKQDPDNVVIHVEEFAKKNLPQNLAMVQWLAQGSTSDSVRLNACKYMVDLAVKQAKQAGDPVSAILAALQGNDTKPQPAHES